MTLDLHNMNVCQARIRLNAALKKATSADYRLRVIHGYNLGSAIKQMVYREFADHPKVLRLETNQPRETILVLRGIINPLLWRIIHVISFKSTTQKQAYFPVDFLRAGFSPFIIFGPTSLCSGPTIFARRHHRFNHQGLLISEVMSANGSALPDENGNFSDWVEIWNSTDTAMNLKGISLSNRSDRARFLFPEMILAPDERIVVFCDKTNQNEAGRELHAKFKISSLQCTVFMFDTQGMILSEVHVPTLNVNETWYLNEDGEYQKAKTFTPPAIPTPWKVTWHTLKLPNRTGRLQINEIMAAPKPASEMRTGTSPTGWRLKTIPTRSSTLAITAYQTKNTGRLSGASLTEPLYPRDQLSLFSAQARIAPMWAATRTPTLPSAPRVKPLPCQPARASWLTVSFLKTCLPTQAMAETPTQATGKSIPWQRRAPTTTPKAAPWPSASCALLIQHKYIFGRL